MLLALARRAEKTAKWVEKNGLAPDQDTTKWMLYAIDEIAASADALTVKQKAQAAKHSAMVKEVLGLNRK